MQMPQREAYPQLPITGRSTLSPKAVLPGVTPPPVSVGPVSNLVIGQPHLPDN